MSAGSPPRQVADAKPASPPEVQIRDAYCEQMAALRSTLIEQCEKAFTSIREKQAAASTVDVARNAVLKQELERVRSSKTSIPACSEFAKPAADYEAAAATARGRCRGAIKKLATDAAATKNFQVSDQLMKELETYCPYTVPPSQFVTQMRSLAEACRDKVEGHHADAAGSAVKVRDRLNDLVSDADERRISVEDLTIASRDLRKLALATEPAAPDDPKHDYTRVMQDIAAALKALLEEPPSARDTPAPSASAPAAKADSGAKAGVPAKAASPVKADTPAKTAGPDETQVREAYRQEITTRRADMIKQCEVTLEALRSKLSAASSTAAAHIEELKQDIEQCRRSGTSIPRSKEFAKAAREYEAAAATARAKCRADIRSLAKDAADKKNFDERERLITSLETYCPGTITPAAFVTRMDSLATEFKDKVSVGHANQDTVKVRDRLALLMDEAREQRLSAEDLTSEVRDFLKVVENAEPLKINGPKKDHKKMLQDAVAALSAMVEDARKAAR